MLIPVWFIFFVGGIVGFLVYGVVRFYRETSLLTENLEFYLKQRTLVHNKDKAKLAVYQSKIEKLQKQPGELQEPNDWQDRIRHLEKLNQEMRLENQSKEADLRTLQMERDQLIERLSQMEQTLRRDREEFAQKLQSRPQHVVASSEVESLKSELEQACQEKDDLSQQVLQLQNELKEARSATQKVKKPRAPRRKASAATQESAPQAPVRPATDVELELRLATQFEEKMRERAQKDYTDILALEKQILRLKLHLEGQSTAFQAMESAYTQPATQTMSAQVRGPQAEMAPVAEVRDEVENLKRVLLQDIRPQMSQYMLELQGLAQRLKETRQSFFETELSRRAFAGLSVKDVA